MQIFPSLLLLTLALSQWVWANSIQAVGISPELEEKIVYNFSHARCDLVNQSISLPQIELLRANILAIYAYCQPNPSVGEPLFDRAETLNPIGDLILLLHAKYRSNHDPKSANALWKKVLKHARTERFIEIAENYLAGRNDPSETLSLPKLTVYQSAQQGFGYSSQPKDFWLANLFPRPSYFSETSYGLKLQRWIRRGSISLNYQLLYKNFFSAHEVDLLKHSLDFPLLLSVGEAQDFGIKPLTYYSLLAMNPYQVGYGIAALGILYRDRYKFTAQGSVFSDLVFPSDLAAESGTHFKFEYSFEFFPSAFYLQGNHYLEHVHTDDDVINRQSTQIPRSHSDLGLNYNVAYNFHFLKIGLKSDLIFRVDTDDSIYHTRDNQELVTRRRKDFQIVAKPYLTVPVLKYLNLNFWYQWNRIYSNITARDYVNRNYLNQSMGIAIQTSLSNY